MTSAYRDRMPAVSATGAGWSSGSAPIRDRETTPSSAGASLGSRSDVRGNGRRSVDLRRPRGGLDGRNQRRRDGVRSSVARRALAAVPDRRRRVARRPAGLQPHLLPGRERQVRRRKLPFARSDVLHPLLGRRWRDRAVRAACQYPWRIHAGFWTETPAGPARFADVYSDPAPSSCPSTAPQ